MREVESVAPRAQSSARAWHVMAASVAGTSHLRAGQMCQDVHRWGFLPALDSAGTLEQTLICAVADGAGSASFGTFGAVMAAERSTGFLHTLLWEGGKPGDDAGWVELLREALVRTRRALIAGADKRGVTTADLASTLILAVATDDIVAAAQVGDGAIICRESGGALTALTTPYHGEHVNETLFLSADGALDAAQWVVRHGDTDGVAIISDGLERLALAMPGAVPHSPFFEPLFRFAAESRTRVTAQEQLAAFLGGPRVAARTDDDVTLLLAVRPDGSGTDHEYPAVSR